MSSFLEAGLAGRSVGVHVALADVVLVVNLREPFARLDENAAVHAVGDVVGNETGRAVVGEEASRFRLEEERLRLTRHDVGGDGAAAGAVHSVEVDVVRNRARPVVGEDDFDGVTDMGADQRTRTVLLNVHIL